MNRFTNTIWRLPLLILLAISLQFQALADTLPQATELTGNSVTQGQFKSKLTQWRNHNAGLLGEDGTVATAQSRLGIPNASARLSSIESLIGTDGNAITARSLLGLGNINLNYNNTGAWKTAHLYIPNDLVLNGGVVYNCASAHTSSTFSVDLAAGKWLIHQGVMAADLAGTSIGQGATMIGVKVSGVGAVARTMADKSQDVVSVQDFGAKPNDGVDDTVAIQKAINSGAQNLLIDGGVYDVGGASGVTISSSMRLYGAATLRRLSAVSAPMITVSASGVEIDGLTLQGASGASAPAVTNTLDSGIKAAGVDSTAPLEDIEIRNVHVYGFSGVGVELNYVRGASIEGNTVSYCGYGGIMGLSLISATIANNRIENIDSGGGATNWYGIAVTRDPSKTLGQSARSTNIVISGNVVSNVPQWSGIDAHAGYKILITGNHVYYAKNGIYAQYDSSTAAYKQPSEDVVISSNVVEGRPAGSENALGIASLGLAGMPNRRIVIDGNLLIGAGSYNSTRGAIALHETEHGRVLNNTLEKSIYVGISATGATAYSSIRGNSINGVIDGSSVGSGACYWVDLTTMISLKVVENRCLNSTGNTNYSPDVGIFYVGSGTAAVFERNRISGLVGSQYLLQSPSATLNKYTDLAWVLESETIKFNYTTTGGAAFESMGSKSASFRRLPAVSGTPIIYSRVSIDQPTSGNQGYGVRGSYGNVYTPAAYKYDGTNLAGGVALTDVTFSLTGVFWSD